MASHPAKPEYELRDPFDVWTKEQMQDATDRFAEHPGLHDYAHYFSRGGMLNLDPNAYSNGGIVVSQEERAALDLEHNPHSRFDRFKQTRGLYLLVALCSAAAAGKTSLG